MLEYLFGSKTRLKLLQIFFRESDARFFVRELVRLSDTQINAVRREIANLVQVGIIAEEAATPEEGTAERRKFYRLNFNSLFYDELRALLLKEQLWGEQAFIEQVKNLGTVTFCLISGKFVGEPHLPTDLLVVGRIADRAMGKLVASYEKKLGFPIRYTILSPDEFTERKHIMDKFLYALLDGKHVTLVDTLK